jgi:hypothetical protein
LLERTQERIMALAEERRARQDASLQQQLGLAVPQGVPFRRGSMQPVLKARTATRPISAPDRRRSTVVSVAARDADMQRRRWLVLLAMAARVQQLGKVRHKLRPGFWVPCKHHTRRP